MIKNICRWTISSALATLQLHQAHAQQAADAGGKDIVVTAERSNRTLDETATSIAVLTGAQAESLGASTTYDILDRIPNMVALRNANTAPAVRGIDGTGPAIGANAFFAGTRPRINFQLDGRTLTFNETIYLDGGIWDMQQIEVYRGPQSTLQGRNAVAGVVAIKTADPTFDWHGKTRGLIGNDDLYQISGATGGPVLSDSVAFRVAADFRKERSNLDLVSYAQLPDPEEMRSLNLRGKLLVQPAGSDFRSLLTLSYTDAYSPQVLSVRRPFRDKVIGFPVSPRFRTKATVGIADTSWAAADGLTLSAFLTATDFRVNRISTPGTGIAKIDGREYTAEPRIRFGRSDERLSGFLAAFLFHSKQHETIDLFGGGIFDDKTVTKAVFGETTYRPSAAIDFTLGARYEEEDRDRTGQAGFFLIDFHRTFKVFLPRGTVSFRPSQGLTVGATIGKGYNAGGAGFPFNPPIVFFEYDKETVWNYEAFLRASLLDGRLQVNGNLFYNDYKGLQLPFDIANNPAAQALVIRNAQKATTYGGELEARYHPIPQIELFGSAGALKTKINRYTDPSVQGRELPRSPAFSFNAGAVVTPAEGLDLSFDFRYSDSYYSDVFNNARGKVRPYLIANGQISYRYNGARIFLSAQNIFDADDPVFIGTGTNFNTDVGYLIRPRRVTGGLELAF